MEMSFYLRTRTATDVLQDFVVTTYCTPQDEQFIVVGWPTNESYHESVYPLLAFEIPYEVEIIDYKMWLKSPHIEVLYENAFEYWDHYLKNESVYYLFNSEKSVNPSKWFIDYDPWRIMNN